MRKTTFLTFVIVTATAFSSFGQGEVAKKGHLEVIAEPGISQMQANYIEENKHRSSMDGYRVQIYNGTRQETLNKRTEFISVFPNVPVYTIYESPEYKVQAGDFRTRLEAEKFLKQVVDEFGSGFVVSTRIKLPSLNTSAKRKEGK